jgi:hypothetical protein
VGTDYCTADVSGRTLLRWSAPAERDTARHLYDALTEAGFGVFFDEVERDRMLGQDLRTYLAPDLRVRRRDRPRRPRPRVPRSILDRL